jgi:hypothetical protein
MYAGDWLGDRGPRINRSNFQLPLLAENLELQQEPTPISCREVFAVSADVLHLCRIIRVLLLIASV